MLRIAISFDYDSPAGYRQSFHMRDFPGNADYEGTQLLLNVLRRHGVKASFGIVGQAALPGEPPDQCQDQIREIHRAGHEIASHSMTHRFIPPMRDEELFEEVSSSKGALEACIGAPIQGFIPPFNRPSHFPAAGAFSISEVLGLDGRGRGRQSIGTMLKTLKKAGFGWSRVSFQSKWTQLSRRFGTAKDHPPVQPFVHNGIVAIPLHETGFGFAARNLIRKWIGANHVLTLYGHPNQALSANRQNVKELDGLLSEFSSDRKGRALEFKTMGEIAGMIHGHEADSRTKESDLESHRTACRVS